MPTEPKIKVWGQDFRSEENYTDGKFLDMKVLRGLRLGLPQAIDPTSFPKIQVRVTTSHPPNDYFQCGAMRIVSQRIRDCLNGLGQLKAQFLPIIVLQDDQEANQFYYCFHVFDVVECIDEERSVYNVYKSRLGRIKGFERIGLKDEAATDHPVFYLNRAAILCIWDSLADRILSAGCTGMIFWEPADWPNRYRLYPSFEIAEKE